MEMELMSKVSVIIPFRNELDLIAVGYKNSRPLMQMGLEIVWVNDGSVDGGERILKNLISPQERLVHTSGVGILSAFLEGVKHAKGDILVFLPLDCNLLGPTYESLIDRQILDGRAWGAFEKSYDSKRMSFYAFLQNKFLLRSGIVAWTNGVTLSRKLLGKSETDASFPQDLRLSRMLAKKAKLLILPGKVNVSARKYIKDGRGVRILLNGFVLILYLLGARGDILEKSYRKSLKGKVIAVALILLLCSVTFLQLFASTSQRAPVRRSGGSASQRPMPSGSGSQRAPVRRNNGSASQRPMPQRNSVGSGSQNSSTPPRTSSRPYRYVPMQWSQESVEGWVFSLPRRNVAIHSVHRAGNEIRIEGSFTSKESLDVFADSLKGDGKRDLKLETKTYYKMGINNDYIIILENEF